MTCHNRRALTTRCLESLRRQAAGAIIDVYLVDDGCTDGTADAAKDVWPGIRIVEGNGQLFWNGGMRLGWEVAAASGPYDYFLWLNDDVVLDPDAIARLLSDAARLADAGGAVIVAGSTRQPGTDEITYGGQRRVTASRPLRFELLHPGPAPIPADTFSGNVVLVSTAAFARLGSLSPDFVHIFGDLDYGLRARAADIPVFAGSGFHGTCEGADVAGSSLDSRLSRRRRLALRLREERKLHARDWRVFVRRHSGLGSLRALYLLAPYLRILRTASVVG